MSLDQMKSNKQKKKRNRFIFRTAILAVLVAAVVFALVSHLKEDNGGYKVGDKAPDFKLQQISQNHDAEAIQLSDLEGKGVMLNFWATWCKPCKEEMPYMQELYPEYKDKGIEIVAVSLDGTELVVDRFIDDYGLTFPILHDKTSEVRDLYKVVPLPSTFFINPDGEIQEVVNGALSLESLEGYLQEIQP
ncbi:thiol-disulfide oxidoreductase ResA [Oceanobacillus profundus]|uniref:Thiol-disulfide oxidoreductase ResA n=1 Tax=Oceanobacillus profundus TaxID=372463 RepID=A0A417YFQ8_9BACI|nr:thiol-disulfide oxidoreductase ResA [Oceanobacillus profundus]MCM3396588.1 thiol-disulfide oxidoreductase ResA [Oceanobacillus profundus]MDO6450682.1 thiol-disulfide oxidoreductase ResA [Oceanobacillus profundus]PAE29822.1 thiol-disulfide oxidoreductase [Paenibacillus sp. 7884-2]RHW31546.1 thiol-disulfide oxidoreductase ResA [Oceanobacillus profundus]